MGRLDEVTRLSDVPAGESASESAFAACDAAGFTSEGAGVTWASYFTSVSPTEL